MASLQLYSQGYEQGLQTFTLAEANLLEATKDTHYTENWVGKTTNPITQETVWTINLTIPTAGIDYISPSKNYQPLPSYPMVNHNEIWYPDYVNPEADYYENQPSDWSLHWRDYYTTKPFQTWQQGDKRIYYSEPLLPQNYSGDDPGWAANTFYKTSQGRYIYWTMDGNYFPFEWGWFKGSTAQDITTMYYGLRFSWARYASGNINWTNQWQNVNNPRFNGVSGALVYGNNDGSNYLSFAKSQGAYTSFTGDQIVPRVYFNFIGFKYAGTYQPIGEPSESFEDDFIGLIAWEETPDGLISNAQIMALSKSFFGVRKKPANGGPISGIQGGNGVFDAPSNNHGDRTGAEVASIVNGWNGSVSGMTGYNMYIINSAASMAIFKDEFLHTLWDPEWYQSFMNLYINPLEAILQCHMLPGGLLFPYYGADERIYVADRGITDHAVPTFTNIYHMKHIGSVDITEYTGSFADYTDTSIYINLPYIGMKQIDTAACMNGWVSVDYATDALTGDCTAFVSVQDRFGNTQIRYEWKGNCSRDYPLKQRESLGGKILTAAAPAVAGIIAGAITHSAAVGVSVGSIESSMRKSFSDLGYDLKGASPFDLHRVAGSIYEGNVGGPSTFLENAASSIGTASVAGSMSGSNVMSNNASGGGVSSPINTNCYLFITRPQWSNPELYERERAYPSDISGKIGDFSGFLSTASVELNGLNCTDIEKTEIIQRLGAGVYLS